MFFLTQTGPVIFIFFETLYFALLINIFYLFKWLCITYEFCCWAGTLFLLSNASFKRLSPNWFHASLNFCPFFTLRIICWQTNSHKNFISSIHSPDTLWKIKTITNETWNKKTFNMVNGQCVIISIRHFRTGFMRTNSFLNNKKKQ